MPYQPPSNRDIGLHVKLNADKALHHGNDPVYHPNNDELGRLLYFIGLRLNVHALAILFNVIDRTMNRWITQLIEEGTISKDWKKGK